MAKPSQNQNRRNRRENRSRKSRQFKGIRMRKWGKWVSEIQMPHSTRRIWLGSYDTPEMAARAYDFAVYCLRGSKAKFNFPHSLPQISNASSLSPPQIQAAAAKYATEKFPLPSEDAAFSTSLMEAECRNDGQEMSVFQDSVPEDVDNGETITLEDFPPECRNDGQEMSVFQDSVLEDVDNGETITLEDFPPECRNDGQEMSVFQDSVSENVDNGETITLEDFPSECRNDGQEMPVFHDSVLEDVDNGETITLEDFPPWDVPMEDFGVLFPMMEKWGSGAF